MSHEPECAGKADVLDGLLGPRPCICPALLAAYERGLADSEWAKHAYEQGYDSGWKHGYDEGRILGYKEGKEYGYRQGYNDHARSREIGLEMFGYVQHGSGKNP